MDRRLPKSYTDIQPANQQASGVSSKREGMDGQGPSMDARPLSQYPDANTFQRDLLTQPQAPTHGGQSYEVTPPAPMRHEDGTFLTESIGGVPGFYGGDPHYTDNSRISARERAQNLQNAAYGRKVSTRFSDRNRAEALRKADLFGKDLHEEPQSYTGQQPYMGQQSYMGPRPTGSETVGEFAEYYNTGPHPTAPGLPQQPSEGQQLSREHSFKRGDDRALMDATFSSQWENLDQTVRSPEELQRYLLQNHPDSVPHPQAGRRPKRDRDR